MALNQLVDIDMTTESDLTTLSELTPTNPGDEPAEIRALVPAVDDAAFNLAYNQLPRDQRVKIGGISFAKYEPLRGTKSQKRAWYWDREQAEELLRATPGNMVTPFSYTRANIVGTLRNRKYWHCKHCNYLQMSTANSGTKKQHLLQAHGISEHGNKKPRKHLSFNTPAADTAAESMPPPTETTIRQAEGFSNLAVQVMVEPFKKALIAFLVICQMPFSLLDNVVFLEFLIMLFPKVESLIPGKTTVRKWIIIAFQNRRGQLKGELQKAQSLVHFSFDLWTSPNHLALLGIVAHFVDEFGQNQSVSAFA